MLRQSSVSSTFSFLLFTLRKNIWRIRHATELKYNSNEDAIKRLNYVIDLIGYCFSANNDSHFIIFGIPYDKCRLR